MMKIAFIWKILLSIEIVVLNSFSRNAGIVALSEVEPEPIEEAVMEQEESSQSIMDLIHANRENSDSDSPDLFSDQNVHQLDETNNSVEADEELETDQDLLEIPSFLRRQSKWQIKNLATGQFLLKRLLNN